MAIRATLCLKLPRHVAACAAVLFSAAILAGFPVPGWAKGQPKKSQPDKAATLYSTELHLKGSVQLAKGDIPGAALTFCRMLVAPGGEDMWTLSVVLLCDPEAVWGTVKQITSVEPVFIQEREYKGQKCYRVCAGLTLDRNEPIRWRSALPPEFLEQKPFPAKVLFPCATDGGRAEAQETPSGQWEVLEPVPAAPAQAPKPQTKTPPMEPAPAPSPLPLLAPAAPLASPAGASAPKAPAPADSSGGRAAESPSRTVPGIVPAPPAPSSKAESPTPPAARGPAGLAFSQPPFAAPPVQAQPQPHVPEAKRKEGEALFQKGVAALQKGEKREAEKYYQRSLEAEPGRPEVLNNLGILYLQQERYEKAQKVLEQAVAKAPNYGRAHLNLAGAFWGQNRKDQAISEAREAVLLEPMDLNAHLTLASFLLAVDRNGEAAVEAKRALALDPQNLQAKLLLDRCPKE